MVPFIRITGVMSLYIHTTDTVLLFLASTVATLAGAINHLSDPSLDNHQGPAEPLRTTWSFIIRPSHSLWARTGTGVGNKPHVFHAQRNEPFRSGPLVDKVDDERPYLGCRASDLRLLGGWKPDFRNGFRVWFLIGRRSNEYLSQELLIGASINLPSSSHLRSDGSSSPIRTLTIGTHFPRSSIEAGCGSLSFEPTMTTRCNHGEVWLLQLGEG